MKKEKLLTRKNYIQQYRSTNRFHYIFTKLFKFTRSDYK